MLKKILFLVVPFLIPTLTHAQYKGGLNDGTSNSSTALQNSTPSIYLGGANDGHSNFFSANQNTTPSIYFGGVNDGNASAGASAQNSGPMIYTGGINDGVALAFVANQNAGASIYRGGINDGISATEAPSQNAGPSIYLGGINDGTGIANISVANASPVIYRGGVSDGIAISIRLGQNLAVPLPVELLKFGGKWASDDAVLNWETGSETKLDFFELERSTDLGKTFQLVETLVPNGRGDHNYSVIDIDAYLQPSNILLYRLKSFGKDGLFKYSAIVKLEKERANPVIIAYPNPTTGRFTLSITNVTDYTGYSYLLMTSEGKLLRQDKILAAQNLFDLSGYANGSYLLTLMKDGQGIQSFKIILTQ